MNGIALLKCCVKCEENYFLFVSVMHILIKAQNQCPCREKN